MFINDLFQITISIMVVLTYILMAGLFVVMGMIIVVLFVKNFPRTFRKKNTLEEIINLKKNKNIEVKAPDSLVDYLENRLLEAKELKFTITLIRDNYTSDIHRSWHMNKVRSAITILSNKYNSRKLKNKTVFEETDGNIKIHVDLT